MKKLVLLVALFGAANSYAEELFNFNEIKAAALTGKQIHIAINFPACSPTGNTVGAPIMVGVYTPEAMIILGDYIVTSLTHFTFYKSGFAPDARVEHMDYTITDKNNVSLKYQYLDAVNYTPVTDERSYDCKIGSGAHFYN